jgi:hypothetical protein
MSVWRDRPYTDFNFLVDSERLTKPHVAARGVPGERGEERESKRSGYYARRAWRGIATPATARPEG